MTRNKPFPPVSALMRHRGDMLLVDSVLDVGDDWITVRALPEQARGFLRGDGTVPGWLGLEYMAQTVNAWAGLIDHEAGREPPMGFLLGTRRYRCEVVGFPVHQALTVWAKQKYLDEDRLALFECEIRNERSVLARAELKAIQPDNPQTIFEEK